MMRDKGYKRFEKVVSEDGQEYFITVNKETGEFLARVPEPGSDYRSLATFKDKDLEKVRADLLAWINDNNTLEWQPVIVIKGREKRWGATASTKSLDLDYKRYFRARRKNGTFIWKEYNTNKKAPGYNISEIYIGEEQRVLSYSDDLWLGLETISELMRQMNDRIHELIERNEIEDMLISVAQKGTRALLGPKEKTETPA